MLLHAEIAAGGRLAIERRRQHAMFDRHALGAPVHEHIEVAPAPRVGELPEFLGGQFDRRHEARCAKLKQQLGRMLIEHVRGVVRDDVAPSPTKLGEQSEMTGEQRKIEREPFVETLALFGSHNRRRAQAQRDAGRRQLLTKGVHARQRWRWMAQKRIKHNFRGAAGRGLTCGVEVAHDRPQRKRLVSNRSRNR